MKYLNQQYMMVLQRDHQRPIFGNQTIGTDAFNALSEIPNVTNVEIVLELEGEVKIKYTYLSEERFNTIDEHLAKFGLKRKS